MGKIRVLDVTLRDGGIVNDFKFGEENMCKILSAVEDSGVDFIELGYIEKNTGTVRGRSQFINEKVISEYLLKNKRPGVTYAAMFDYGKFDVDTLGERRDSGIDAIRFAFHKRNFHDVKPIYEKLIAKGYEVYMQPMVTLHYSDEELEELLRMANGLSIKGIYFVDTFGQMHNEDIMRLTEFFDGRLRPDIALGFHAHNNIQMAFSNAIAFLQYPTGRDKLIDSSIMGMGRGAGNLNTELILQYLNKYYGSNYDNLPLLKIMDTVLSKIKAENPWGYSAEYYLSSANDCSPIYSAYYYKKHMLPIERINELLKMVEGENRISFKKSYAEEIYRKYNAENSVDDTAVIDTVSKWFKGKKVCVIAPGKSLVWQKDKVEKAVESADITVSLNCSAFNSKVILITREEAFSVIPIEDKDFIVTSNVNCESDNRTYIIDYLKWISIIDDVTLDSAGYVALNLLIKLGASKILLAGFDGFSSDINGNYFSSELKRPVTVDQLDTKNRMFADFIKEKSRQTDIEFVTDSIYAKNF
ncbi:MAG: aldolase catalytic domain-containing protein [Clostridia bacterium]|nr:aldolase catalytic domain-containing protein [Clostridia bacterium]MBR5923651.1 aldolase catalytic domain-containing protein [Clostridia bacterium]